MKHSGFIVAIFFLTTSCQFFETKKISKETFFEEEINSINWNEVDQYPVFLACENFTEKRDQKSCFETTLSTKIYQSIPIEKIVVSNDLNDTIFLEFNVNVQGKMSLNSIEIDSLLQKEIPLFESYILQSIDSLQPIAPAYKRGIPVQTTFTLPIVIKTD